MLRLRYSQHWIDSTLIKLVLVGALLGSAVTATVEQATRASAFYTYESPSQYVKDEFGNKTYQDTKVDIGDWVSVFGYYVLPVQTIATWTNIMVSSYSFNNQVFRRTSGVKVPEVFYTANSLTYSNTPRYITRGYYDDWDSLTDVVLSRGDCQSGGECSVGSTYSDVTVPWHYNSPYVTAWGIITSYP